MKKSSIDPTDTHVGNRVRQARNIAKLSQEKLGEAIGVTFQQVQKYEKGANRIAPSRLQKISIALGKPVAWFFAEANTQGGAFKLNGDDPVAQFGATADGIALARAFNRITDMKRRHFVVGFVENIAPAA